MNIGQEVSVVCTDNDKKVNGKIIRLYRGGLDVAIDNTIIKMQLKKITFMLVRFMVWNLL